jgi:aminoglycoside 2''-phosphotransferase
MASDTRLDAAQVASILEAQFSELSPARVVYLGEGCDSRAFDVNQEWVFRFPKRAEVERQLAIESRILPALAQESPLPMPVFSFHGRPSVRYPYRFAGYRKLPGVPGILVDRQAMPLESWAPAMGRFLSWLHRASARQAQALGVPQHDVAVIGEARAEALEDFALLQQVIEIAPFDRWREFFEAGCGTPTTDVSVLVHGDLAVEHLLYDAAQQQVTGVIDWSDIAVGDRSIDLAAFLHWGGRACLEAGLSTYDGPIDDGVLARARFLAACRGIGDIAFGLETGRREYLQAGERALRLCLDGE